ncbi:amidohydrolase family protein [Nocardia sp. NPDC049149]|uniref:amidohydrolase family protein n=1 Tax=Nocardia sp. NPDC049149 TaxID=3364315 RepID=UPI0037210E16
MVVDAHFHLWDIWRHDYPHPDDARVESSRHVFGPMEFTAVTAPYRIEAAVLVQELASAEETRYLLAHAVTNPMIAGVVGWVDLTAPDVAEQLAALNCTALTGIRHPVCDEPDPRWLLRDDVMCGLRAVGAAGLAYDLHISEREMPAAIEAAATLPETRFVIDHLALPRIGERARDPWAAHFDSLATLPNVTAKLSGLITQANWTSWTVADLVPYTQHALEAFGPDRLMFGSDWPISALATPYEQVLETTDALLSGLNHAERTAVMDTTARRVYCLPARHAAHTE